MPSASVEKIAEDLNVESKLVKKMEDFKSEIE